jgi:hypothetical protein
MGGWIPTHVQQSRGGAREISGSCEEGGRAGVAPLEARIAVNMGGMSLRFRCGPNPGTLTGSSRFLQHVRTGTVYSDGFTFLGKNNQKAQYKKQGVLAYDHPKVKPPISLPLSSTHGIPRLRLRRINCHTRKRQSRFMASPSRCIYRTLFSVHQ